MVGRYVWYDMVHTTTYDKPKYQFVFTLRINAHSDRTTNKTWLPSSIVLYQV